MNRILVLRPEPAAGRTAAKAAAMGLDVRVHPLFAPQSIPWTPPAAAQFDALLLTSANAVHLAGAALNHYASLPAYAVGQATARALRSAGFPHVVAGAGDGSAIAASIAADGHRRLLHLAGTTVAPMDIGPIALTRVPVYSMVSLPSNAALIADAISGAVILVHSPRAGEKLATQIAEAQRPKLHIVAISPAALATCGTGWASAQAPVLPDDDEMLALARRLCE